MSRYEKFKESFKGKKLRESLLGYAFIALPLVIFFAFSVGPIIFSVIVSFYKWGILTWRMDFVGLENYMKILDDRVFIVALRNTLLYTIVVVPSQTLIAMGLALLANQKIRGATFFKTTYFTPAVTSSVVISLIFFWLYMKEGLINYFLSFIGIVGPNWLFATSPPNPNYALLAIMMMNIWSTSGYYMVMFLAGLQSIPEVFYEAARIDRASRWQRFRYITLPLLKPVTYFVVVLSVIGTMQIFDQVYVMTRGGPYYYSTTTVIYHIWNKAFRDFKMGYASAIAWVLFAIIFVATMVQRKLVKEAGVLY